MLFLKEEKVFSLSKATAAVPFGDTTSLFQEFYCYLLIAGLFREGEGVAGVHFDIPAIAEQNFIIPGASYSSGIAYQLTKGLQVRYQALSRAQDLNDRDRKVLAAFNYIFTSQQGAYITLSGKDILGVAASRDFPSDLMVVARYLSVMFGQTDFASAAVVPRLYISVFGNIHLAKSNPHIVNDGDNPELTLRLEEPTLRYGTRSPDGDNVTALWAMLSATTGSLAEHDRPGDYVGDILNSLLFLGEGDEFEKSVPAPRYASALYIKRIMGLDQGNPISLSTAFYQNFLYGSIDKLTVSRQSLLLIILNVMMEKMGETHLGHLFTVNSFYRDLATAKTIYGKTNKRPALFQFALEALATEQDGSSPSDPIVDVDPERDPQTDDGGFDPSLPPPVPPIGNSATDKDTIDLISFDKSGEGVNEDLYRSAVVALNDRLRSDETLLVDADARETLNQWVGGWIYRTAISATKDLITSLKLQSFLKNF